MRKPKIRVEFKKAIKKKCGTLSAFAYAVGVSHGTVSTVANGYRQPTDEQRKEWAKALGMNPDELF